MVKGVGAEGVVFLTEFSSPCQNGVQNICEYFKCLTCSASENVATCFLKERCGSSFRLLFICYTCPRCFGTPAMGVFKCLRGSHVLLCMSEISPWTAAIMPDTSTCLVIPTESDRESSSKCQRRQIGSFSQAWLIISSWAGSNSVVADLDAVACRHTCNLVDCEWI